MYFLMFLTETILPLFLFHPVSISLAHFLPWHLMAVFVEIFGGHHSGSRWWCFWHCHRSCCWICSWPCTGTGNAPWSWWCRPGGFSLVWGTWMDSLIFSGGCHFWLVRIFKDFLKKITLNLGEIMKPIWLAHIFRWRKTHQVLIDWRDIWFNWTYRLWVLSKFELLPTAGTEFSVSFILVLKIFFGDCMGQPQVRFVHSSWSNVWRRCRCVSSWTMCFLTCFFFPKNPTSSKGDNPMRLACW